MKTIGRLAALALAGAALSACGAKEGRSDHPADADSGQAAPATVPTVNNPNAPDSTAGVAPVGSQPPGIAGDTLSSKQPGGAKPPQGAGTPRRP